MIAHLMLMGAAGCQTGTRFVMSEECTAHDNFKKRFSKARAREAVSTPSFDRARLPVVAGSLMAGQSVGLVDKILPMKEIFSEILGEAEEELRIVKARLQ
jgi:NAD(P)H-dependent flavin oxidoreductase YrpB (nitropropane dioxygenase family)